MADWAVAMADWNLAHAARRGDFATAARFLADPRVNPAAYNNLAIRWAAVGGHDEVVALLLADPRVDPSAEENQAIRDAAYWRYAKVVALLLADPRVDPGSIAGAEHAFLRAHPHVAVALARRR